ncbi:putative phage membrane domain protein [Burkholderia thailandensis]|uniref:Phage membrane domain protein n=1 Tax=Burkholderia thailandensis TaxID=57975 RepID=A0AAW9CK53_BURTH|nr:putative phage membrane domain protein [Burkholderia thailandensis]MDW9251025.1 putative phage membrane domain protein [Burkholderia thailandensis]
MTLQVEFWQLASMFATFVGLLGAAGKALFVQIERHQADRDQKQEEQLRMLLEQIGRQTDNVARVERDFLKFQADLPLQYVRREDYVRNQTVIEAKLDAVALKIENLQLRGARDAVRAGRHRPCEGAPRDAALAFDSRAVQRAAGGGGRGCRAGDDALALSGRHAARRSQGTRLSRRSRARAAAQGAVRTLVERSDALRRRRSRVHDRLRAGDRAADQVLASVTGRECPMMHARHRASSAE